MKWNLHPPLNEKVGFPEKFFFMADLIDQFTPFLEMTKLDFQKYFLGQI